MDREDRTSGTAEFVSTNGVHKKPKRLLSKLLVVLLVGALGAGAWFYYQDHKKLSSTKQELKQSQEQTITLTKINDELSNALDNSVSQSDYAAFPPECGEERSGLLLAKFNKEPIEGHNVYLYLCKDAIGVKPELGSESPLLRVAVLKLKDDGTREFIYGSSSIKPFCLREDVIGAGISKKLSIGTRLDICN